MEERHNPNSLNCLRQDTTKSWSELPLDLLISVFERLSFANFQRAKSVCSSWHSASKQSVSKILPWLILFPKDNNNSNSCMLFNPDEKDKLYKTGDLGVECAESVCMASYGSWFLMQDPRYNLYIVNIFTGERISLPPAESQLGMTKIERTIDDRFLVSTGRTDYKGVGMRMRSTVFWIDEKTKDYVVICGLGIWCVVYTKKGDKCWNQIPELQDCRHMVYKDHKLYFSNRRYDFRIFDFSREIPQQIFQDSVIMRGLILESSRTGPGTPYSTIDTKLVVTVTGDVLKVDKIGKRKTRICNFFEVYKVYSSGYFEKYERVRSLGEEAILWDLGISVHANDIGLQRNSIYFSASHRKIINDTFIFNLETDKMDPVHKFECSLLQLSTAPWFSMLVFL